MKPVNEIELVYRNVADIDVRICRPSDAANIARNTYDPDRIGFIETSKVILLNNFNVVLGVVKLAEGGTKAVMFEIKLVLAAALKANASGIVLVHNHPSGNLKPSASDMNLTKDMRDACKLLDIKLLDHVILDPWGGHFSFADEGLI